jgi:uncharacterized protein (DUF362 family)
MQPAHPGQSRRKFLYATLLGGVSAVTGCSGQTAGSSSRFPVPNGPPVSTFNPPAAPPTKVALTSGRERADMTFQALKSLGKEIAQAIGSRPIVLKPNLVVTYRQLSATHADAIEGILEFLKSIKKLNNVVIAESPAAGSAMYGYEAYHYVELASKYNVKLIELDQQPVEIVHVLDELDMRPHPVRVAKMLLDDNSFVISAAPMKTHNLVVATLSLKNVVLGSPIKDQTGSDKPFLHGNGFWGINYNIFSLARRLHPDLSVVDGFRGMQGDGPVDGSPVDHKVCVAGLDWCAVDHTGARLMGIDPAKMGYLNLAASAQLGQSDPAKIELLGEPVEKLARKYTLASNAADQFSWVEGPQRG